MIDFLQMSSNVYRDSGVIPLSIALAVSLIIATTAALNMIEKKRMSLFMPFFIFGLGICLTAAFMFYDFFGVAVDVFYTISFVSVVGMFFIIWRAGK